MRTSNFSRRGFLKSLGLASAAIGGGPIQSASAQVVERPAPPSRNRSLRGADLPAEHFRIRRNPIKWPNNARIAVCWIVNYEGYSDSSNSFDIAYKDYSCKAAFWR